MKPFLKFEHRSGEELASQIVNESGLMKLLDDLYDAIDKDSAVEVHIYRKFTLIGTRTKGHGDKMTMKFTNFGFGNKTDSLASAIRSIDDGSLPQYCYRAIAGDIEALRQTTAHVVRAYDAKIRRMLEKAKSVSEVERFVVKRDIALRRLELQDADLMEVSEPIIIEIPKDPDFFYGDDDIVVGD